MTETKTTNLVDPKQYAEIVSYELKKALRFTPLASVDDTLVGQAGSTIVFPKYTYIGDAADLTEGEAIPVDNLGQTTQEVKIKEAGKGTGITDTAMLTGLGDPVGESTRQLALALANKIDDDLMNAALAGTQTATITATVDGIQSALDVFNDDGDYPYVAVMSPKTASKVRADAIKQKAGSEAGADQIVKGTYYDVLGVQIVRTRKMADDKVVFIKVTPTSPALKLVRKRDVMVETERHAATRTTDYYATAHYAAYVYDDTKIVVATIGAASK